MKFIGFIGHGEDKFEPFAADEAQHLMLDLMRSYNEPITIVSGHSPVGGVDIWAEQLAAHLGLPTDIKAPKQLRWDAPYGFKQRNLDIARSCDELHVILVDSYPRGYKGMRFESCYHCASTAHVKSGACWTGQKAVIYGTKVFQHIISNGRKDG